jgi:hypothetical protein
MPTPIGPTAAGCNSICKYEPPDSAKIYYQRGMSTDPDLDQQLAGRLIEVYKDDATGKLFIVVDPESVLHFVGPGFEDGSMIPVNQYFWSAGKEKEHKATPAQQQFSNTFALHVHSVSSASFYGGTTMSWLNGFDPSALNVKYPDGKEATYRRVSAEEAKELLCGVCFVPFPQSAPLLPSSP